MNTKRNLVAQIHIFLQNIHISIYFKYLTDIGNVKIKDMKNHSNDFYMKSGHICFITKQIEIFK